MKNKGMLKAFNHKLKYNMVCLTKNITTPELEENTQKLKYLLSIWKNLQWQFQNCHLVSFILNTRKVVEFSVFSTNFSLILQIVSILIEHLQQKKFTTIRDIYYLNTKLFSTQRNCKNILELAANSLAWDLSKIGIVPSQKGLIYGKATLQFDGVIYNLHYDIDPFLIPMHSKCIAEDVDFVVVIEKEAVFQWFCKVIKKKNLRTNFIAVTGKGFPDRLTKKTVQNLAKYCQILAFFDADVYGISICKSYEVPSIVYCGMFLFEGIEGSLDIGQRDRIIIVNLIKKSVEQTSEVNDNFKRELTRSLFLGKKAEMNLSNSSEKLQIADYLIKKIKIFSRQQDVVTFDTSGLHNFTFQPQLIKN